MCHVRNRYSNYDCPTVHVYLAVAAGSLLNKLWQCGSSVVHVVRGGGGGGSIIHVVHGGGGGGSIIHVVHGGGGGGSVIHVAWRCASRCWDWSGGASAPEEWLQQCSMFTNLTHCSHMQNTSSGCLYVNSSCI